MITEFDDTALLIASIAASAALLAALVGQLNALQIHRSQAFQTSLDALVVRLTNERESVRALGIVTLRDFMRRNGARYWGLGRWWAIGRWFGTGVTSGHFELGMSHLCAMLGTEHQTTILEGLVDTFRWLVTVITKKQREHLAIELLAICVQMRSNLQNTFSFLRASIGSASRPDNLEKLASLYRYYGLDPALLQELQSQSEASSIEPWLRFRIANDHSTDEEEIAARVFQRVSHRYACSLRVLRIVIGSPRRLSRQMMV